jgi:hypothetical protein
VLNETLAACLAHPIYDPLRPWLARLPRGVWPGYDVLNALAEESGVRTASGRPVRFVAPGPTDPYYELHVHGSGRVATRPQNLHDLFNALAWLAFPRTKATINALHAAEIPRESGRRGRVRDLLTLFDEGGAIVLCDDPELEALIRAAGWKELFWDCRERVRRGLRFVVLGHAVLEKALDPWPGIACKVLFAPLQAPPDQHAAEWLRRHAPGGSPRLLAPLPVFGYPGWLPSNDRPGFYLDERYFRRFRRDLPRAQGNAGT